MKNNFYTFTILKFDYIIVIKLVNYLIKLHFMLVNYDLNSFDH